MTGAYFGLERDEIPHASIITRVAQQLGGSFGVAVLAVILTSAAAGATSASPLADAFDVAFWWAIGFTVLAVGLSFLLPAKPARGRGLTQVTSNGSRNESIAAMRPSSSRVSTVRLWARNAPTSSSQMCSTIAGCPLAVVTRQVHRRPSRIG